MVNSINTNASSLGGLQNLNRSQSSTLSTNNQIATGKKVNGPKDDAATFAIAQKLLGEVGGLGASGDSLDRALSTASVAEAAGNQVSDLLLQLKEKAVAARDPGLDDASRQALNNEFASLRDQIGQVVKSASFNGTNAVEGGGGDIAAITNQDGSETFTIANQDLSLGGGKVTLAADASIGTAADAANAVAAIEQSLGNVSASLSTIGSGARRLEQTREFNQALSDTTEIGIGNLVDANLGKTSAQQAANGVREQLGIVALNIANRQPSSILSLFQK
ncbi:flagellin [Gimibacter soli]|uniref:Flagellin n=1 Tax=Gimibacter soli TaxID=3024400 RepID=A0AAE9XTX3_9PROT|nr:flagellin [Gimibacter soli]WCL55210.1 flagellin [Gimibacter soli]